MIQALTEALFGTGGLLRVRGLVTLGLTFSVAYLFIDKGDVPTQLLEAWFGWGGVYIGSRVAQSSNGAA